MAMKVKELTGDEFWVRCPFCGDSQRNQKKSHFSVNLRTGKYHCYKCSVGGVMPIHILLRLVAETGLDVNSLVGLDPAISLEEALDNLIPGPATQRVSKLERFHLTGFRDRTWDAFHMTDMSGDIIGVLLRSAEGEKASYVVGSRGLLVPPGVVIESDMSRPIRVVEGPYDVLSNRDVGISGFLSRVKLSDMLRGQFITMCPDGDVWVDKSLMTLFSAAVFGLVSSRRGPWPVNIEFLPDGRDPDEVPVSDRVSIKPNEFLASVRRRGLLLQYRMKEKLS